MSDLRIARRSAVVVLDGTPHRVRRGRSVAHADSPVVREHPELWRVLPVDFPAAPARPAGPAPKDVRAWARAQGIDVPARGQLPADVVAQYQAAHE